MTVIKKNMRAIYITSPYNSETKEIDESFEVNSDSLLLKILYVGFCGTDLNSFRGRNPLVSYPRIPGHEISAEIVDKGKSVSETLRIGDIVTVIPYTSCGRCSACKKERFNACKNNQTLGVQRDGAMKEFLAVPEKKIVKNNKIDKKQLCLVEPLAVGFHAVRRAKIKEGEFVAVYGCGIIGIGAMLGALNYTKNVIAIDIADSKLEYANSLGIPYIVNSQKDDLGTFFEKLTNGMGPDTIIEAVGVSQTFTDAIEYVCYGGKVIYVGYVKDKVSYDTKKILLKELDILGSRGSEKIDFENVVSFFVKNNFDFTRLFSKEYDIDNAHNALYDWNKTPELVMKLLVKF